MDLKTETAYYLALQDYFIANPDKYEKLSKNSSIITVHVPRDNVVCREDADLIAIAKSGYCFNEDLDMLVKIYHTFLNAFLKRYKQNCILIRQYIQTTGEGNV